MSGTLGTTAIAGGRLNGEEISFKVGETEYTRPGERRPHRRHRHDGRYAAEVERSPRPTLTEGP